MELFSCLTRVRMGLLDGFLAGLPLAGWLAGWLNGLLACRLAG